MAQAEEIVDQPLEVTWQGGISELRTLALVM